MKNNRFYIFSIILLILINISAIYLFTNYKNKNLLTNTTSNNEYVVLKYRIEETARINSRLVSSTMFNLLDVINAEGMVEDISQKDLKRGYQYFLIISANMCGSCINDALEKIRELDNSSYIDIISNWKSQREFLMLVKKHELDISHVYYFGDIPDIFVYEEVPILIKINHNNSIEKACFVDRYLPSGFYENFLN